MGAASHSYGQFASVIGHISNAGVAGGAVGANADESVVIGNRLNTGANAIGSIVIGGGITGGASMTYNLPHSIAMGINSSIPTVVVSQANGAGTTGNVGIGTGINIPINKTDINGAVAIGTYAGVNTAPTNGLIVSGKTGIGTAAPSATLQVNYVNSTNDGSVVFVGADPPTYLSTLPISGAGNRLMWLPDYGAFRAGVVTGTQWDQLQIGHLSFAVGENTSAYGTRSFVMGYGSSASDENSFAGGNVSNAAGNNSFAFGNGSSATFLTDFALGFQTIAQGGFSFAANDRSHAYGASSFATGGLTTASGGYSSSFGLSTIAGGVGASAFGSGTTASGDAAVSMGSGSTANGTNSMAVGENSGAYSRSEFVLGRFNEITSGDPINWVLTDPIFQIGNSEPFMPSHNAMTVFKNGKVCIGTISYSAGSILTVYDAVNLTTGVYDGSIGWASSSDERLKTEIKPLESSLDKILKLQGVSYKWKKNSEDKNVIGFIAQDVEKIFPEAIKKDKEGNYLMATQNLTAPIIEAIKEQQLQLKSKDESIQVLNDRMELMQKRMDQTEVESKKLNDKINDCCANSGNSNQPYELNNVERTQGGPQDAAFFENKLMEVVPNPFSNFTTVKYHLKSTINSAVVTFQNGDGKILSSKIVNKSVDGQFIFECGDCPSGIYFCILWVDGRKCDTRLLVLNK